MAGPFVPLVALAAAGPLLRGSFMGFLDVPEAVPAGVAALSLRMGLVLTGAMSLYTYGALVRGPERAILDPHPALPQQLLRYLLMRTALERATLPVGVALLTLPVLLAGHPLAWALGVGVALGGWVVGLLSGFTIHLGSVWAAESPGLAGVLNALRGHTPKLQAALIYAPGVVLALGGVTLFAASEGARLVLLGHPLGALGLLVPAAVGWLAWLPGGKLAERYHFRATVILAEIDGAYAGQEDPDEARSVYLEWTVRLLPAGLRVLTLKELRHGWRGLRSWVTGAWGLGLLGAAAAWSKDPEAIGRSGLVAGAGLVLVGVVAHRLAATDPDWLDRLLLPRGLAPLLARAFVLFAWLQALVLLPVLALWVRQGLATALPLAGVLQVLALAVALLGAATSRLPVAGLPVYLSAGVLLWAGLLSRLVV